MDENKQKIAVMAALGLILFLLVGYVVYSMSSDKEEEGMDMETEMLESNTTGTFDLPDQDFEESFSNKVDAYGEREQEDKKLELNLDNLNLDFDEEKENEDDFKKPEKNSFFGGSSQSNQQSYSQPKQQQTYQAPKERVIIKEVVKEKEEDPFEFPERTGFTSAQQARNSSDAPIYVPHGAKKYSIIVQGDQTVSNTRPIKLRLLDDIFINGKKITKNSYLYGNVSIQQTRINISVNHSAFSTAQSVYDEKDGLPGISAQSGTGQQIAKDGTNNVYDEAGRRIQLTSPFISFGLDAGQKKSDEASAFINDHYKLYLLIEE